MHQDLQCQDLEIIHLERQVDQDQQHLVQCQDQCLAQVHQDLVDQIVVQEILHQDQVCQDLVDQIVVQEIMVIKDLVDQIELVHQQILIEIKPVDQIVVLVDLIAIVQHFQLHHQVVQDLDKELAEEMQLVHLENKTQEKNVRNQNVKKGKSSKNLWKRHNLVVCNYLKVMAEQFV